MRVCIYYLFIPNYICKILGAKSAEAAKALDAAMASGQFNSKKDAIASLPTDQRAIVQQQQDFGTYILYTWYIHDIYIYIMYIMYVLIFKYMSNIVLGIVYICTLLCHCIVYVYMHASL